MKRIKVGSVTLKCWDLGGQPRFRSMWERYCRGVDAIIYVLDSADPDKFELAKKELHALMERETASGTPLLVLGNKNDLPEAATVDQVIEAMDLKSIHGGLVTCYSISVKEANNLNSVLSWLISRKKSKSSTGPASA